MWYAFIQPDDIRRIQWGSLAFVQHTMQSVMIEYVLRQPASGRFRKGSEETIVYETLYIASADETVLHGVLADLLCDEPVRESVPQPG